MSLPHSLFLVIFGASGDLTRRKLMPALIKIHNGKRFPEHFAIIGCARTAYTDETYRAYLKEELIKFGFLTKEEMETLDDFLSTLKSATKPLNVLIAFTRPLITEFADNLNLKHPLLPTISPYPTM